MFCSNCGTQLLDQAKFCTQCGAKVQALEAEVAAPETTEAKPVALEADTSETVKETEVKPEIEYYQIARTLAHFVNLSIDQTEEEKMEEQLLAGGEAAQEAIFNYLIFCSSGKESAG
jgi:hypothetical protein